MLDWKQSNSLVGVRELSPSFKRTPQSPLWCVLARHPSIGLKSNITAPGLLIDNSPYMTKRRCDAEAPVQLRAEEIDVDNELQSLRRSRAVALSRVQGEKTSVRLHNKFIVIGRKSVFIASIREMDDV